MASIFDTEGDPVRDTSGEEIDDTEGEMTGTTWASVDTSNKGLVRKALRGGVLVAPMSATPPDSITIDSTGTPVLNVLTGYANFGKISTDGATLSNDITTSDIDAWGDLDHVRSDITADTSTLHIVALETNKTVLSTYWAVPAPTPDTTTKEVQIIKPSTAQQTLYRLLVVALDGDDVNFSVIAYDLPNVSLTAKGDQQLMSGDTAIQYDMTFTCYKDATLGYAVRFLAGGPQWKALTTAMGWS